MIITFVDVQDTTAAGDCFVGVLPQDWTAACHSRRPCGGRRSLRR